MSLVVSGLSTHSRVTIYLSQMPEEEFKTNFRMTRRYFFLLCVNSSLDITSFRALPQQLSYLNVSCVSCSASRQMLFFGQRLMNVVKFPREPKTFLVYLIALV
ncbi:hypothetical protein PC129_g19371 [Phytophthora cactorum]|uniref:Uncharacterized protein n=1 Tax=Phytophthora cactorum TaxID=29920 RepID=A0A8T1CAD0_9STRA|nr:hypothetical protein PC112_g11509 [Phytophthora cactorum]KAG2823548.1 hypothetical protein PC111_g10174 [Phytophthora cactorum]KAG2830994.1 hypothetical protein PC113_g21010 [Phytophthora cactorum]KAG2878456.1 hypothetical protein PC114_g23108 [Phytophthora cactorum]KAG2904424.1 hypothetical protein PC117_g21027 [Phytophthora cactorum]